MYNIHCISVQQPPGFEKMKPGQSRPIQKGDLKTIESQLARHQLSEQKAKAKKLQREDPFHADPWDNSVGRHEASALVNSSITTNEEFFSLDLTHSLSESHMTQSMTQMEDSFAMSSSRVSSQDTFSYFGRAPSSITGRSELSSAAGGGGGAHIYGRSVASDLESIPLHEGVGLQQLSRSPPFFHPTHHPPHQHHGSPHQRRRTHTDAGTRKSSRQTVTSGGGTTLFPSGESPPCNRLSSLPSETGGSTTAHRKQHHMDEHYEVCKYSFTISGVTLALLEADPMHVHSTPATTTTNNKDNATSTSESPSPSEPNSSPHLSQSNKNAHRSVIDGGLSSVDEGGLDPLRYFETVAMLLEQGINRKVLQVKQEELSQVLPNDHLL